MNVYVPLHVVLLLRRIVNVLSTLSISNQYYLLKNPRAEEDTVAEARPPNEDCNRDFSWDTLRTLRVVKWRWWWWSSEAWDWPKFLTLESVANAKLRLNSDDGGLNISSIALPSFSHNWAWLVSKSLKNSGEAVGPQGNTTPKITEMRPQKPSPSPPQLEHDRESPDIIHRLLTNPALLDPVRKPRNPIVLCHGLYGFDVRGPSSFPSLRMHYWSNVLNILRDKVGADVIVTSVPGTGSIASRSESLNRQLEDKAHGHEINLLAHSMGGLDCRHLISHIKPTKYAPLSLTTISTPHRGSPFMDWCAENIGIGKLREKEKLLSSSALPSSLSTLARQPRPPNPSSSSPKYNTPFSLSLASLPSSFTTLLLSMVDSPAYFNLTTSYLNNIFNPSTPNDPRVKYFSVAGRMGSVSVWHPLWLPKMVLDGAEEKARDQMQNEWKERMDAGIPMWKREDEWGNDGLVTVQSSRWGEFLGIMEGCDHWEMRGARGIELDVDIGLKGMPLGINLGSDGWGWREWGKLVGAWKREERRAASVGASGPVLNRVAMDARICTQEQEKERVEDEALFKSSTDKLSTVFDWLVEQVPLPAKLGSRGKSAAGTQMSGQAKSNLEAQGDDETMETERWIQRGQDRRNRNELETKLDLERFYVALSRKLYDEGL